MSVADALGAAIVRHARARGADPARYPNLTDALLINAALEAASGDIGEAQRLMNLMTRHQSWARQKKMLAQVSLTVEDVVTTTVKALSARGYEGAQAQALVIALRGFGADKDWVTLKRRDISAASGIPDGSLGALFIKLQAAGRLSVRKNPRTGRGGKSPNSYLLTEPDYHKPDEPGVDDDAPTGAERLHKVMSESCDPTGLLVARRDVLCERAGVSYSAWDYHIWSLIRARRLEVVQRGRGQKTIFRLLDASGQPVVGTVVAEVPAQSMAVPRAPRRQPKQAAERAAKPSAVKPDALPVALPVALPAPRKPRPLPVVTLDLSEPLTCATPNSLLSLSRRTCRWPLNDPPRGRADLTTFCCEPTAEPSVYCATHRDLAEGQPWKPRTADQTEQSRVARARAAHRNAVRRAMEVAL